MVRILLSSFCHLGQLVSVMGVRTACSVGFSTAPKRHACVFWVLVNDLQ